MKPIASGKIICQVPSDCALALSNPDATNHHHHQDTIQESGDDLAFLAQLAANFLQFYVHNPEQRHFWSPYLDTLPQEAGHDATPDYFESDEEIALLEFPRLIRRVQQRQAALRDYIQSQEMAAVATESSSSSSTRPVIDWKELQHAAWIVSSRSIPIISARPRSLDTASSTDSDNNQSVNSEETVLRDERGQVLTPVAGDEPPNILRVLVPLLDMCNYHSQPNARLIIVDPEKDHAWFALEATRPIPAGKEITLGYLFGLASPSSVELLLNYGFVPAEKNPVDSYMLKKGGDDVLQLHEWSTTLEEDRKMLEMLSDDDVNLRKILNFRIRLKEAYSNE